MTGFLNHTDDSLLRLANGGQEDAFVELYQRRQLQIYKFALHMCGSSAVAEEVTQEVFMSLIRNTNGFDAARGSVAGYLYGIARKQVLRMLERDRQYVAMEDDTAASTLASSARAAIPSYSAAPLRPPTFAKDCCSSRAKPRS